MTTQNSFKKLPAAKLVAQRLLLGGIFFSLFLEDVRLWPRCPAVKVSKLIQTSESVVLPERQRLGPGTLLPREDGGADGVFEGLLAGSGRSTLRCEGTAAPPRLPGLPALRLTGRRRHAGGPGRPARLAGGRVGCGHPGLDGRPRHTQMTCRGGLDDGHVGCELLQTRRFHVHWFLNDSDEINKSRQSYLTSTAKVEFK